MVYVFLAEGFEEVEALTPVDCLRRAGKDVCTVGIGGTVIKGSHGIPVTADLADSAFQAGDSLEMVVLPGGMPGTIHLGESSTVQEALNFCVSNDKWIAAICAAPSILGARGLLSDKTATCYPGFEEKLLGCNTVAEPVCQDGWIITGRGPGAAMDFALKLVEVLCGKDTACKIAEGMVYTK